MAQYGCILEQKELAKFPYGLILRTSEPLAKLLLAAQAAQAPGKRRTTCVADRGIQGNHAISRLAIHETG